MGIADPYGFIIYIFWLLTSSITMVFSNKLSNYRLLFFYAHGTEVRWKRFPSRFIWFLAVKSFRCHYCFAFETGSLLCRLEIVVFLPQPPECWNYRHAPSHPAHSQCWICGGDGDVCIHVYVCSWECVYACVRVQVHVKPAKLDVFFTPHCVENSLSLNLLLTNSAGLAGEQALGDLPVSASPSL